MSGEAADSEPVLRQHVKPAAERVGVRQQLLHVAVLAAGLAKQSYFKTLRAVVPRKAQPFLECKQVKEVGVDAEFHGRLLVRISHHLTVEARHKPAITALRLLTVPNVLFKYASAR